MVKKSNGIPRDNNIIRVPLEEAMPDNYLPYAVEVAKDRALPDVRDGLKPVHRRILYGAHLLRATPDKPYYKSARIVGDILGKFHPHGDSSVYDAMVILAQDFTTRKPLIDGHGNWGSIDGDSAAAMRYTEARLTPIAMEMIRDIDKDVVNMVPNYSDSELEPEVLPSRYPNLLVNGAFGIAVGLATNIPPHNLREVVQGLIACIDNSEITTKELMEYIKGPDLPTGGILIGKNSLLSAYETGEGRVTLRVKASIEKLETGRLGIVITEFPYRKNKAKILQTISEMTGDKKHSKALEAITDIRDESDRNGIRAVIEFRKSTDYETADKVLKYLYKKTDLQSNLSFNMVALAKGKPETLGLKSILMHYLDHQKEVITRRTQRELDMSEKRYHIVEGFIKAIDIMDKIIETIRASISKKDAQEKLVQKFGFSELQSEAILELMLYRLTGLEIKVFEKEYKDLEKLIAKLRKILGSEKELLKVIKDELLEIVEKFGDDRRTEIIEDETEAKIDVEELIIVEDTMITMSNEGYIKRIPLKSYNRSNTDVSDIEYREGDYNKYLLQSNTRDTIVFFTDKGNMYQLKGTDIPEYKWKEKGEKLDTLIRGLDLGQEKVVGVFSLQALSVEKSFLFITSKAYMKKTSLDKFVTSYTKLLALKLKDDEKLICVELISSDRQGTFIEVTTKLGLNFTIREPRLEDADRNLLGTQLTPLSAKDELVSVTFRESFEFLPFNLTVNSKGTIKQVDNYRGKSDYKLTASNEDDILIFADNCMAYKLPAYMFQNAKDGIKLEDLISDYDPTRDSILEVVTVGDYNREGYIYFFSKKGLIKKTALKELNSSHLCIQVYKLKSEADALVSVKFAYGEYSRAFIVTKKAMAIKFEVASINAMGKIASGVTGISLKEDDEVVFGDIFYVGDGSEEIAVDAEGGRELLLTSNRKEEKRVKIVDIKLQNRAGRGNCLMLIVLDDYVKDVKIV
ncbi:DNA topoisomerase IV subunit A [Clostridium thermarum]|uniref:DNA topoisomerase IV subunit A n=1 Tax=Clostridium thermarum TaxID=1716543 RepID=UPI0013D71010|nr:DNA topoisomerase IV subunit A [Clostridium thermarum]